MPSRRTAPALLVALLVLVAALAVSWRGPRAAPAELRPRAGALRFDPAVAPFDRRLVLGAIARARPEARALIADVGGAVLVHVGRPGPGELGLTEQRGDAFDVTLDLATALRTSGERGVSRLVLHELGHVVDGALIGPALERRLDAGIPRGYGCGGGGVAGACAARPERFAETFAKWATGDIGLDLYVGYEVPPPGSLEEWGRPLVKLASSAG